MIKLFGWMKMKSLKSVLRIYCTLTVILVLLCYFLTIELCNGWRGVADQFLTELLNGISNYSIVVYSVIGIILMTHFFFKNKIEEPMMMLGKEDQYLKREDLSISCRYESGDEFGELCNTFDQMRLQMVKNYESLWNQMESQRKVTTTFAHDIRNPLTVIQGYLDMLIKYYPMGKIKDEKLIETCILMQAQVRQLNQFSDRMKELNDIESIEVIRKKNTLLDLQRKIEDSIRGIGHGRGEELDFTLSADFDKEVGYYDESLILQVFGNVLLNAVSFAEKQVKIIMEVKHEYLRIYVQDDGCGFSTDGIYKATTSYYSSREKQDGHFGMGLTICKLLCEKHGGQVKLSNSVNRGAIVCISFHI